MPGVHAGRPPHNKGLRYPADPPQVEEIIAVMRAGTVVGRAPDLVLNTQGAGHVLVRPTRVRGGASGCLPRSCAMCAIGRSPSAAIPHRWLKQLGEYFFGRPIAAAGLLSARAERSLQNLRETPPGSCHGAELQRPLTSASLERSNAHHRRRGRKVIERVGRRAYAAAAALPLLLVGSVAAASPPPRPGALAPIHGPYAPQIDPAKFVATIDNRYLPYQPGTTFHYEGVRGTTAQTDDEVVLRRTKRILGVKSTVVRDTVSEHGRAVERTDDWYAQDKQGNVWYMGEDSFERKHGRFVKAGDSWKSGVNGAEPGIIMPADPRPRDAYRQEYYPPGKALDEARVLRLDGRLTVPYGAFTGLLVTSERSPLEPQTEHKYYAPGVAEIAERVVKGPHEEFKLVSVTH